MSLLDKPFTPLSADQLTNIWGDDTPRPGGWNTPQDGPTLAELIAAPAPPRDQWPQYMRTAEREQACQRNAYDQSDERYEKRLYSQAQFWAQQDEARGVNSKRQGQHLTDEQRKANNAAYMRQYREVKNKSANPKVQAAYEAYEASKRALNELEAQVAQARATSQVAKATWQMELALAKSSPPATQG